MKSKKGLSTVVTTLIIILLVLVAIGIIWFVIQGLIEDTIEDIDVLSACPQIILKATAVECSISGENSDCSVTLRREDTSDYEVSSVDLVFINKTGDVSDTKNFETSLTQLQIAQEDIVTEIKAVSEVSVYPRIDGKLCRNPSDTYTAIPAYY